MLEEAKGEAEVAAYSQHEHLPVEKRRKRKGFAIGQSSSITALSIEPGAPVHHPVLTTSTKRSKRHKQKYQQQQQQQQQQQPHHEQIHPDGTRLNTCEEQEQQYQAREKSGEGMLGSQAGTPWTQCAIKRR